MKNENQFNAYLSKEFRARHSRHEIFHLKASDKFTAGVSDFLLWGNGYSCGLETKFTDTIDRKANTLVLEHTFTGAQQTYLESMRIAGSGNYGLVAVKDISAMFLINGVQIPESGNWTAQEFAEQSKKMFHFGDIDGLLAEILWRPCG